MRAPPRQSTTVTRYNSTRDETYNSWFLAVTMMAAAAVAAAAAAYPVHFQNLLMFPGSWQFHHAEYLFASLVTNNFTKKFFFKHENSFLFLFFRSENP